MKVNIICSSNGVESNLMGSMTEELRYFDGRLELYLKTGAVVGT